MKKVYYVYLFYRDIEMTDPFYVGKGKEDRVGHHEIIAKSDRKKKGRKYNSIRKCLRNFGFLPKRMFAVALDEATAFEIEKALIKFYGRLDIGTGCLTNLTDGGEGPSGAVKSPETRKKLGESLAKIWTPERRKEFSEIAKARPASYYENFQKGKVEAITGRPSWNKDKIASEEAKRNQSLALKNKPWSEERKSATYKQDAWGSLVGRPRSEESKANQRKSLRVYFLTHSSWNKGKSPSKESIAKRLETMRLKRESRTASSPQETAPA